jgi:hypothetical protein
MLFENRQLTKIDEVQRRIGSQRELIIFEDVEMFGLEHAKSAKKTSNFSTFPRLLFFQNRLSSKRKHREK